MVVRKFNYYRFFIVLIILIVIIFGITSFIKDKNYKKTYEYKLTNIGYSIEDVNKIEKELNSNQIDKILTMKYYDNLVDLISEKYFIFDYLEEYINYKNENKKKSNAEIVKMVNTKSYLDWFDNQYETDITKNELMLVNRYYGLSEDYEPDDIVDVPTQYAYSGKKISKSILDKIISLINAGKQEGFTFVVSDGYRSYKEQENIYNNYVDSYGMSQTDEIVARPGHSEYQTGLSFDLKPYNQVIEDVSTNSEYLWLKDNAYKYGFIFRFEKEHESVTQFPSSSWRLRYVGDSAASLIYSEKISFEEYYAFFVENNN